MRAVVFPAAQRIELEETADPTPGRDELLVRVRRAGICGTDLHIHRNEYLTTFPLIPGHELVGTVEALGSEAGGLAPGDRVTVDPNLYCHRCPACRDGRLNHCHRWAGVGITRAGAFAERIAVPARACYKVPDRLDDAAAAMIEPTACVVHAMNRLAVRPGESALLFGAGPIGLLLLQALARRGAGHIAVVEKRAPRRALAERFGASEVVAPGPEGDERLRARAAAGFPVVVDATGVPAAIESAIRWLAPAGRYLQFGVPPKDAEIGLRPFDLFRHDWTLLGSFALASTFEQAIGWLESGRIEAASLVSDVVGLDGFADAFERFARGETLKVQIAL